MATRRLTLFDIQRGLCFYCQREMTLTSGRRNSLTRDHLVPRSRGGGNGPNVVGACYRCNQLKGSLLASEFHALYLGRELPEVSVGQATASAGVQLYRRQQKAARRKAEQEAIMKARIQRWWRQEQRAGFDPVAMGYTSPPLAVLGDFLAAASA